MGYYLATWKGPSMTMDDFNKGSEIWQGVLKEFPDIKNLYIFGSLSKGHIVCTFEAPSVDSIRSLFDRFDMRALELGLATSGLESEVGLDILPLEIVCEGDKLIYQRELAHV